MAWVIVQKSVRLSAPGSLGVPRPEHTVYAWLEVYEKRNGNWMHGCRVDRSARRSLTPHEAERAPNVPSSARAPRPFGTRQNVGSCGRWAAKEGRRGQL